MHFLAYRGLVKKFLLKTQSGFPKFHYQCDCGNFWVKTHCFNNKSECGNKLILKHYINFHEETTLWNVKCPKCNKDLSNSEQKQQYIK